MIFLFFFLLALHLNRREGASFALTMSLFAVLVGFPLVAPDPADVGIAWYFLCALGDVTILVLAVLVAAPASRTIMFLAAVAVSFQLGTAFEWLWTDWWVFYSLYPYVIPAIEVAQIAALLVFSPPIRQWVWQGWLRYRSKGGSTPWKSNSPSFGPMPLL